MIPDAESLEVSRNLDLMTALMIGLLMVKVVLLGRRKESILLILNSLAPARLATAWLPSAFQLAHPQGSFHINSSIHKP